MKIFGKNRESFIYCSDTQLKDLLVVDNAESFRYVFDRYDPLLKKNIENAFHVKSETAKKTFNKRCNELHDYLLADNCAKLKLFDPKCSTFEVWLAVASLSFFKKTFCDENTALVERYRKGDDAIVYQRYKNDFEEKIRLRGNKGTDVVEENAKDLAYDLKLHLFDDNYRRLNTYDPSKKSFDAWFKTVLNNFSIDQYKKTQKKEKEVINSGGFVRIDNEATSAWETSVVDIQDEEKEALLLELRELLNILEPPRYREVLIALFFDREKREDVAERLHITVDNLYNLTKRALDRFRKLCKEHEII